MRRHHTNSNASTKHTQPDKHPLVSPPHHHHHTPRHHQHHTQHAPCPQTQLYLAPNTPPPPPPTYTHARTHTQVSELVRLRLLDLEGCEGLTASCLPHLAPLTRLTGLNLGQCPGLKGHKLHHIAGGWVGGWVTVAGGRVAGWTVCPLVWVCQHVVLLVCLVGGG